MLIDTPGIYDIPDAEYHADPCPTPSFSAGMINDILLAPAKCFINSRRLNPKWEAPDGPEKFTIGTVTHIIHLEPHLLKQKVRIVEAPDWRGKPAREARDAAKAEGLTPILSHQMDAIFEARAAFEANEFVREAFRGGKTEQSLFWLHPTLRIWCRARPDFISDARTHMNDHKATADANPEQFGRHAWNMGYHRRAAWYLDGAKEVFGQEFQNYWFISQENKKPYLTSVVELDMSALEAGRIENERAARMFVRCMERGQWPGYRHKDRPDQDLAFQVGLPPWAYMQIDGRE